MQTTFEQAVEVIKSLPNEDLSRFDDWFEAERKRIKDAENNQKKSEGIESERKRFAASMNWIEANKEKYKGQWLALDGDVLLASGQDGKKVYAEARAKGIKNPLLHRISNREELPFGGW